MAKPTKEWGGVLKGITIYLPGLSDIKLARMLQSEGYQTTTKESDEFNAVLFSGHGPISPILYGEAPVFLTHRPQPNYLRDRKEWRFLRKLDRSIPKIGVGRGAHLLNAFSGGSSYQDVSGHANDTGGTVTHKIKLWTEDTFDVFSNHFQQMVPGADAFVVGSAQKAYYKRSDMFDRKYKREERLAEWDDAEIIHYWYNNCFCFEPDPTGDADTDALFTLLLKEFFDGRME